MWSRIQAKLTRLMVMLRILDGYDQTLSLTSIGLMVIFAKVAMAEAINWPTLGTLAATLLMYAHKRHVKAKVGATAVDALGAVAEDLKNRLVALENRAKLGR